MIEIFTILLIALSIYYYIFLLFILLGLFKLQPMYQGQQKKRHFISIIVSARNEEKNLSPLIIHLSNQNYPPEEYEIIIVNDRSTDNSEKLLKQYGQEIGNLRYINIERRAEGGGRKAEGVGRKAKGVGRKAKGVGRKAKELIGKKNALHKGIAIARGEILVFTDADCRPPKTWLSAINRQFTDKVDVVVGYSPLVSYKKNKWSAWILFALKRLERLSIFAISAGTIGWNWGVTCTARNFAYRKSVYDNIDGFSGIGHIPSGDDDLMLQKISKFPKDPLDKKYNLHFATDEESYVPSIEDKSLQEQYQQEKRRASKWKHYPISIKILTSLIFIFYALIVYTFILIFTSSFSWILWLILIGLKICVEFILLLKIAMLLNETKCLLIFPLAEIFYILYFLGFAILGSLRGYKWK